MNTLSVVLCTYNGGERLESVVEAIAQQSIYANGYCVEILIVDNNSSPATRACIVAIAQKYPFVRCFNEERQGQTYARLRGICEARGDYIAFVDDDNVLSCDYFRFCIRRLEADSSIGAVGGTGVAPSSLQVAGDCAPMLRSLAIGPQAYGGSQFVANLYGAASVMRAFPLRRALETSFPFAATGRRPGMDTSGDDYELCFVVQFYGLRLWYEAEALFEHRVDQSRLTHERLLRLAEGLGGAGSFLRIYTRYSCRGDSFLSGLWWTDAGLVGAGLWYLLRGWLAGLIAISIGSLLPLKIRFKLKIMTGMAKAISRRGNLRLGLQEKRRLLDWVSRERPLIRQFSPATSCGS